MRKTSPASSSTVVAHTVFPSWTHTPSPVGHGAVPTITKTIPARMGWAADACSAASSKSAMDSLGASSGCVCHSPIQCSPRENSAARSTSAFRASNLTPPRPDQTAASLVASSTTTRSPRRSLANNCPTLSRVCLRRCVCRRNVFNTRGRNSSVHDASGMRNRTDASDIKRNYVSKTSRHHSRIES